MWTQVFTPSLARSGCGTEAKCIVASINKHHYKLRNKVNATLKKTIGKLICFKQKQKKTNQKKTQKKQVKRKCNIPLFKSKNTVNTDSHEESQIGYFIFCFDFIAISNNIVTSQM